MRWLRTWRAWNWRSRRTLSRCVPHSAVIAGQVTDEARAALAERADVQVLALTDRVWQAGEAYSRAALLVEEAAVEAGRAAR